MIILSGSSRGLGKELAKLLEKNKIDWLAITREHLDYSKPREVERQASKVLDKGMTGKKVIYIANTATIGNIGALMRQNCREIESVVSTNFTSHLIVMQRLQRLDCKIHCIYITSGATKSFNPGIALYSLSKLCMERSLEFIKLESRGDFTYDIYDPGSMISSMRNSLLSNEYFDSRRLSSMQAVNPESKAKELFDSLIVKRLVSSLDGDQA